MPRLKNNSGKDNYRATLPTSVKKVEFRKGTPISMLKPAKVIQNTQAPTASQQNDQQLSTEQMKAILEEKKISLKNTAVKGTDLDKLIKTLYEYRHLFATSIEDLPGCNFKPYVIESPGAAPIRSRRTEGRPSKTKLLMQSYTDSISPWSSNLVLISKPDQRIRLCVDYRKLNSVSSLQASNLSDFPQMLDHLGAQQPQFFSSWDLKMVIGNVTWTPKPPRNQPSPTRTKFTNGKEWLLDFREQ
jgi:hypothetical protein